MPAAPDIYPMPSFPVLEVADPAHSASWYQDALGFQDVFTMANPDGLVSLSHLRWTRYADLLLRSDSDSPGPGEKGRGVTLTFAVTDGTVDAVAERARQHGAQILSEPEDKPWNARECTVADPDGFQLTFTQGPLKPLDFNRVMAGAPDTPDPKP
ncbi:VOC family protein [Rubrivirga sp.]|uniref:VOC family protein n=1 Tax=Rubrivirga sp. TaxID=1885344 RepID=UPI003C70D9DF